jgi:hypothetical protein
VNCDGKTVLADRDGRLVVYNLELGLDSANTEIAIDIAAAGRHHDPAPAASRSALGLATQAREAREAAKRQTGVFARVKRWFTGH